MITVDELKIIIRNLEKLTNRVIGTKDESGILISLREDSQAHLLEVFCRALNMKSHIVNDKDFFDDWGNTTC